MQPTIHDIAKISGVSKSTVSRALTNSPLVNEETRQRVLNAAELLNYRPNAVARAMITKKTGNIGFIIYQKHKPIVSHPFYAPILESIVDATNDIGYNLYISSDKDVGISSGEILLQKKVDGLILASRIDKDIIVSIKKTGIPLVIINNIVDMEDVFCIVNEDFSGTTEAVEYLIGKGHKRIGMISGPLEHYSYSQRYNAYISTLKKNDITVDYHLIQVTDSTYKHGYDAMRRILSGNAKPTAVFCANDMIAIGAIKAIKHVGLSVPNDIAVVGFDDIEFSSLLEPSLTTVSIDKTGIGELAVEIMKKLIDKQPVQHDRVIMMKASLVIRDSA